ncbi:MAG: diacylglycerol kinase family protein [Ruthenibacterium sp.]
MKHVFIVNPVSGKVNADVYYVPKIKAAAEAAGLDWEVRRTEYKGHAVSLAREYGESGASVRLYACGGDGTLNEVFTGGYPYSNVEIASIPCGSGNDFVRNYGGSELFLDLADNMAGTAIPIDLVSVNGGISAAISSIGIDSEIAYCIPKYRHLPLVGGHMAYSISIAECLCKHIGRKLRVEIDGEVVEDTLLIATVCNGVAYGGGFMASPNADLEDGLLEVILVKKMGRLRLAGLLSTYKAGAHLQDDAVVPSLRSVMTYCKAKKVNITPLDGESVIVNIDGECTIAQELCAEILPLAARFVLPAKVYAAHRTHAAAAHE